MRGAGGRGAVNQLSHPQPAVLLVGRERDPRVGFNGTPVLPTTPAALPAPAEGSEIPALALLRLDSSFLMSQTRSSREDAEGALVYYTFPVALSPLHLTDTS